MTPDELRDKLIEMATDIIVAHQLPVDGTYCWERE